MTFAVVFEAEIRQQSCVPRRFWIRLKKISEPAEIIRAGTFHVAMECGGQSPIFGRRWIWSDGGQGVPKDVSMENVLRCGIAWQHKLHLSNCVGREPRISLRFEEGAEGPSSVYESPTESF